MPFRSVSDEMKKWRAGKLHSGSSSGPVVKSQKQAIAISLNEARRHGQHVPGPKGGSHVVRGMLRRKKKTA